MVRVMVINGEVAVVMAKEVVIMVMLPIKVVVVIVIKAGVVIVMVMGGFRGGTGPPPLPPFSIFQNNFCNQPSEVEWHSVITPRMFMCCGYGAMLRSCQKIFRVPSF